MMKFAKTKKISIIVLVTILAILLSSVVLFYIAPERSAEALTTANLANAYKVGENGNGSTLNEAWDAQDSAFNAGVMADLVEAISPSNSDLESWLNGKSGKVANAAEIRANVQANTAKTQGVLFRLNNIDWMLSYLTLVDINGVSSAVATLYAAQPIAIAKFSLGETTNYVNSEIRTTIKNNSSLALFKDDTTKADDFSDLYIVKPDKIAWQKSGQLNTKYSSYQNTADNHNGTSAWKDDTVWLPSLYEMFSTAGKNETATGLWALSEEQRGYDMVTNTLYAWLRSAYSSSAAFTVRYSAQVYYQQMYNDQWIRPALHLNLTAAALGAVSLKNPANVTTVYNGNAQTLKGAYAASPSGVGWYNAKYYEHADNYVKVTPQGEMKNAGEYWVKAEITQNWIDAVNAKVDAMGVKYGWSETQIAEAKSNRKPRFRGDPVEEDGHEESDIVRWFKFTIKPKELAVNKPSYNATTGVFTAPSYVAGATNGFSDVPALALRFTGNAADGTAFDQIDKIPNKRGTYTAQAILVNSTTDKTPYSGGNFVIKDAANMTCSVQVNRARLAIPVSAEPSKPYTGSDVKFILPRSYDNDWREIGLLILPEDGSLKLEGNDTDGWYLVAKDAGTYTVTAAIKSDKKTDWCWNTSNFSEEIIEDRTITVTVTKATLFVDFMSSTGAFLLQKNSNVTFGVEPSNPIDGDDVHVSLQYYNAGNPDVAIPVPSGKLNAAALEPGKYRLEAYIVDDLAKDNKNYALDTTSAYQDFTISAQGINLPTVGWQYRENGGLATPIAGGETSGTPFAVTYTGGTYVFSLAMNAATLANSGVKVDGTYGVNGYRNSSQVNATENAIAVSVRLIPYSAEFSFNDENGQQSEEQFKIYTLYIKVDKATIDFSKVVWSADELEYSAFGNGVEVVSGIPSFLSITYNDGARGLAVGDYKAEVRSLSVKNNAKDIETAANYNVPSLAEVKASEYLKHDWRIVKRRINVTWVPMQSSIESSIVWIPYILDNSTDVIEYSYYLADDASFENKLNLEDIMREFDATKTVDYLVYARVNNDNYVLFEAGKEVEYSLSAFQVGDNKIPVRVNLKTDSVVYNGTKQEAEVEVDAGGIKINIIITYFVKEGDEFVPLTDPDQPTNAAEYKIRVALTPDISETMAISGQREFLYTIEKAEIDLSGLKWVDASNENEEYTEPYVYKPGVTHKLTLSGVDAINALGLDVTYDSATEANRERINAGKYKVIIKFTESEFFESNYKVPEDLEFEWEITPYTPDLSGVTWNYNAEPFIFKIKDGVPVMQNARLIGFPEGYEEELASMIVYGDDDGEYSDVSTHKTSYSVNEDHEKRSNYGAFLFPSGLETAVDWEIHPLKVEKTTQQQTKPFAGEGYSFEEITNLPEDFAEYFDVTVLDATNQSVEQTDGTWRFVSVGKYRIQIRFKDGMNKSNGGKVDNVKWSDNSRSAYQVTLTIEKLVLDANGWIDGEDTDLPTLDSEKPDEIEKYFDYVLKTQAGEIIDIDTALGEGKYYTIAIKVKPEYAGSVFVSYKGQEVSETVPYAFRTKEEFFEPTGFVPVPSDEELTIKYEYIGSEITFELGDWFDEDKMTIVSGEMKGTEAGDYHVVVGFNEFANTVAWGNEDKWSRNPVTVTFVIYKNDDAESGRFILTDEAAANHPYKFQYEDYKVYDKDISEYVYSEEDEVFMARLAHNDTLADLLAQFKNGSDIKVFDAKDVEITDMTKVLSTGLVLRLMDGTNVLNQLTISVLGDIDGDGKIGTLDKAQLNAYTLGTRKLDGAKLLAGDIDGDGKIGTLDKAQLNAYTLGSRDIYATLRLTANSASAEAAAASAESITSEEVMVNSEEVVDEVIIAEYTIRETTEAAITPSEDAIVNKNETAVIAESIVAEKIKEMSIILVDTRRMKVSF